MLEVTAAVSIADGELEERFVRASGPGGQNVNKVATAVELRFDLARSSSLSAEVRARLRVIAGSRLTTDGVILIDARRHRTQAQNRVDARERLAELIRQALVLPSGVENAADQGVRATTHRVEKHRAETKRGRGPVGGDA